MALGFYHEDRNGLNIVGHGGDTVFFHSDLHLFLDKNVGLFISMNSVGKNGAAHALARAIAGGIHRSLFPAPAQTCRPAAPPRRDGRRCRGHYVSSRAGGFSLFRMIALLGETSVAVDKDGILIASSITILPGSPRKWREVKPFLWQEVNGADYLQAVRNADGEHQDVLDHALRADH